MRFYEGGSMNTNALSQRSRGSILWVAMLAIVLAMGITMSMLQTSVGNLRSQEKYTAQNSQFFTTHGTTELALSDFWMRYSAQSLSGTGNFVTWLNDDLTSAGTPFTVLASAAGDKIGEDFRSGPPSFTLANNNAIPVQDNPTKIYRAVLTKFNDIVMGDRRITGVRLYKKERPKPGAFVIDMLVVAETQRTTGATAAAQASLAAGMKAGDKAAFLQPQWEAHLYVFNSPPPFNGFDFAFLTKNLSCTLCHLHVRNRDRLDNQAKSMSSDPAVAALAKSRFGTFDRVKVGVTDNMTLRQNSMQSVVEGTFYQRGALQFENSFAAITPGQMESQPIYTTEFNDGQTTIKQDPNTGYVNPINLHNETTDASGNKIDYPAAGGNCYLSYSSVPAGMTDGNLPSSNFPSPFPEIPKTVSFIGAAGAAVNITGADNQINADEISAAATGLIASSDPNVTSSISGGSGVLLAPGTAYNATSLPSNGTNPGITGSFTGNAVLTGTQANPIKIDGKVLIDGDVILRGYIQGTGQIFATGNVYLPGDLVYNNVNVGTLNEQFGVNNDPNPLKSGNLVGIMAGKNIMVGDYLSQNTTWDSSQSTQFTPYSYNSTTKQLTSLMGNPDPGKLMTFGDDHILNPNTVGGNIPFTNLPTGAKYPDGSTVSTSTKFGANNFPNLIMQQVAIFNRFEIMKSLTKLPTTDPTASNSYLAGSGVANPYYDPNYIPKFYSLYRYDPSPANRANTPPEVLLYPQMNWDANRNHWTGAADPHSYSYFTPVDEMPAGSISDAARFAKNVLNLHPDWITPQNMMRIISDETDKRVPVIADPVYGSASDNYKLPDRRLDGVLYTKNAIFCVERTKALKYNTGTGQWSRVNTLSGGHMQVNGAIIAPDTCILVNGAGTDDSNINNDSGRKSFMVNYDPRVRSFIGINNQDFGGFTTWAPRRVALTRTADFMPPAP